MSAIRRWYCGIGVALLANLASAEAVFSFNLGAGSLAQALEQVSRITGEAIIFTPESVQEHRAPALAGQYSASAAMAMLLANAHGLAWQKINKGWLVRQEQQPIFATTPAKATVPTPANYPIDETLVIGTFSGNLRSRQQTKQQATQQLDSLNADDIGRFPALNIAEALKRTPGISVVRDRGEALFISVRGLPTSFSQLTVNGFVVAANENTRTSEQYGRRFHYDTLPAELVARVDVKKSALASDSEGAIGGSVDITTFKPFAINKPYFSTSLGVAESTLAASKTPKASGLFNWLNSDNTLGILLAASYAERNLRQDRVLNFRWYEIPLANSDNLGLSPDGVRPTLELEERARTGLHSAVQWRPSDTWQASGDIIVLKQHIAYDEFSYSADYTQSALPTAAIWRDNALIGGQVSSGAVQISRESAGMVNRNHIYQLSLEYQGDAWQQQWSLAHSQADSYNDAPIKRTRLRRTGDVHFDFLYPKASSQQLPDIVYHNISLNAYSDFPGRRLEWRKNNAQDTQQQANWQVHYTLDDSLISSLQAGAQWQSHRRQYQRKDHIISDGIAGVYFPEAAFTQFPVANFLHHTQGNLPRQWLIPDEQWFWRNVDEQALLSSPASEQDHLNSYRVNEHIGNVFVALALDAEHWQGNLGLRSSYTQQAVFGYQQNALTSEPSTANTIAPVAIHNHYQHWLPSLNIRIPMAGKWQQRIALGRALSRPNLPDLAPRFTFNSGDENTISAGNPQLKPVLAWQADWSLEHYFSERGMFAAGLFANRLSGFIQTHISQATVNGQSYELTQSINGGNAHIYGAELSYQQTVPGLLPNHRMGFAGNYTYTHSRAAYRNENTTFRDSLADVARHNINLELYYEAPSWAARLNYNWRDEVLSEVGIKNLAAQNSRAMGYMDARIDWYYLASLNASLEVTNLTNASEVDFVGNHEFASYTHYGRTFMLGLSYKLP